MRVKVSAGLATMAAVLALWLTAGGDLTPPTPTPTPTSVPGACLVVDACYPKPPGSTGNGVVGVPDGTSLVSCGAEAEVSTPGAVIDGCIYTGNLTISASNVTIRNSRVAAISNLGSNLTIEDSEIGPLSGGCAQYEALVRWSNYTVRRSYIHGNGDGLRFSGANILAEDNVITTCSEPDDHSDAIQGYQSGTSNVIRHNTIDLRGSVNGPNGAIFFADFSEQATITDNLLLATGGNALRIHDDNTPDHGPWIVTGNRILGGKLTVGLECGAASTTWTDNRNVTVNGNYDITSTGSTVSC